MKKYFKFFGIIVLVAVIGFSMTACGDEDTLEISGTVLPVYSSADGIAVVTFIYGGYVPCTITTNMDAPNNSFTLNASDPTTTARICGGVNEGQKVTWSAKVNSGSISANINGSEVFIKHRE
jgi:hypothetical protein